ADHDERLHGGGVYGREAAWRRLRRSPEGPLRLRARETQRAAAVSLAVGCGVLLLKALAAWRTGSLTLLSDALESVVNVIAAGAALLAVRIAARPADDNHPFGHAKAEYFSAALEGTLVVLAARTIAGQAVRRFGRPPVLPELGLGVALSAAAAAINWWLSSYLATAARQQHSPALRADAVHVRSDVWTSVAALGGIAVAWATQLWILDALIALAVAGHILGTGLRAVRGSIGGLMDEAVPVVQREEMAALIDRESWPVIEHHDLR